ncbi:MAG: DUF721 domain-containing protein [Tannerella sp.]|jgi:predicted nucleic acid-binding Zn ribbon protein|nr:DUF721 domain-containing protein [Tannerella sp.]
MNRQDAKPIGSLLEGFFDDNPALKERVLAIRAERAWGEVLGPAILQYTRSLFVKNRVLHVALSSAVLRQELALSREKILKSLNAYVGEDFLRDLVIR